jgi:hypothetical protein
MDIISAFNDQNLFGSTFSGPSWRNWRAVLRGIYGLPMSAAEMKIYGAVSGRTEAPHIPATEAHIIAGRRSGKSTIAAGIAVYTAIARDYRPYLAPGAFATIFVVSPDRTQSRIVHRTVRGLIEQSPLLRDQVARDTETSIELKSGVAIEVGTASARTLRGYSCPLVILDEEAFFDQAVDAADADESIIQALLPSLATIPGSMLLGISSPYARRGVLWDRYSRFFGHNDSAVQVYKAPTRTLNPTIPQSVIDAAMEKDPQAASAEWLAEFRADRDTYVSREIVDQCVSKTVFERAPQPNLRYVGFVDPAGGAGADSFCAAVAHLENGIAILDCVVTRKPPFNAEAVVAELAAYFKRYGVVNVRGDHFSGDVIRSMFQKAGIIYSVHPAPKREIFRALLPLMTSGKIDLLDNTVLHQQLVALERQVSRGGTEIISHPLGAHDDLAVAAAGALVIAAEKAARNSAVFCPAVLVTPVDAGYGPSQYDSGDGPITLQDWPGAAPGGSVWPA